MNKMTIANKKKGSCSFKIDSKEAFLILAIQAIRKRTCKLSKNDGKMTRAMGIMISPSKNISKERTHQYPIMYPILSKAKPRIRETKGNSQPNKCKYNLIICHPFGQENN